MSKNAPNRKLGIVQFESDVSIVGDGSQHPEILSQYSPAMNDKEFLIKNGTKQAAVKMTKTISEAKSDLVNKVN